MLVRLCKKHAFTIFFIVVTFCMGLYIIYSTPNENEPQIIVTVKEGDSIWSIAEEYAEIYNISTIELVKLIEKENNHYVGTIKSGEQLVLPKLLKKDRNQEIELALE